MRTSVRIATSLAGAALAAMALTACGGGSDQGGSTAASDSPPAKQTAPAVTALPQTGGIPDQPVCSVISKDAVEQAIGKSVYSANDKDFLSGTEQANLCHYYVDADEVSGIKIEWATPEDALWNDYYNNPGATVGGDTVRAQVTGLTGDAYKEVGQIDGVKTLGYNVFLKDRGIVLSVYDTSGLSDTAVRGVTKAAIKAVNEL